MRQEIAKLAVQDTAVPVNQEPVIELSASPPQQQQPKWERLCDVTINSGLVTSGNAIPQPELARPQGTGSRWLRWVAEQVTGVVCQLEAEEKAQEARLLATTEELEMARSRIRSMEEDIEKARTEMAKLVIEGPQQSEPVAPVTLQNNKTPLTEVGPDTNKTPAQELATLREDLAAQEALRARERELKKVVEEEQRKSRDWSSDVCSSDLAKEEQRRTADNLRRTEESLRRGHQVYDRLKEEKEKLLKEKEKLRRMAEVEIERLKEELRQHKVREDYARRLINQKLKQKTDDFDQLH